jgi:DNA-binding MarR family transcriptional regulator
MEKILVAYFMDFIPMTMKKVFKGIHHEYTRHQIHLLYEIKKHGAKPMRFYGEKLMISKPNMTSLVGKLVDENLLVRIHDENDRRKVMINVTEEGKAVLHKHGEAMRNGVKERLSVLTKEEKQELVQAFETFERILKKIEE